MLIDSHAHMGSLESIDTAINNARENSVSVIINMSSDYNSAIQTVDLVNNYPEVYGAVGIHPHEASSYNEKVFSDISELADYKKIVAIGETGLDYYYDFSSREIQKESLQQHINLSIKLGKPVIIHMRDSDEDVKKIIKDNECDELNGVMHCFTADYESALYFIDMGFYISFSGILTFKRSEELREVARKLPLDRILIETDSPYLAPVPYRGKKNEPAYVRYVAEKLAEIRGEKFEKIAEYTSHNTKQLFNLS